MCGILGVIKKDNKIDVDGFVRLLELQDHRGPDGSGFWFDLDGRVALGHNRLSIIDLKQGGQPMINSEGNLVITYNGELYNYKELKSELLDKNHVFKTESDTEVVLEAYKEWGDNCVNYFRGMYAFAIVDAAKKTIFLARDCFGIKPLVYYRGEEIFCFASEISTLADIGGLDLSLNYKAIDLYLWLQYIPAPDTAYKKIKKLEPGHIMKIDFDGKIIMKKKFWSPEFKPDKTKTADDWLREFDEVISDSVRVHTVSDVSYGAFLSGGIDSSLIVKYLSTFSQSQIKTFSIGFEEKDYNELPYSSLVSKRYKTDHTFEIVKPDFFNVLSKLVKHYGEPFGDSSAIPTYYLSKLAAQQKKVILSGDGGDEFFGGYNSYATWRNLSHKKQERSFLMNTARYLLGIVQPRRYPPEKPSLDSWLKIINYFNYYSRKSLWKEDYSQYLNRELAAFNLNKKYFKNISLVNKAQFFDILNYLPFDILTKVDIASMANGLEVRVPLIDKKVAEFALTIPETVNIGENGEWKGKLLLKNKLIEDFSPSFVYREKKGFALPLDKWFGLNGELYGEPYLRLMNSDSKLFKEMFNLDAVYNFISSGESSKIYLLLFLEEWLRQYENHQNLIKI